MIEKPDTSHSPHVRFFSVINPLLLLSVISANTHGLSGPQPPAYIGMPMISNFFSGGFFFLFIGILAPVAIIIIGRWLIGRWLIDKWIWLKMIFLIFLFMALSVGALLLRPFIILSLHMLWLPLSIAVGLIFLIARQVYRRKNHRLRRSIVATAITIFGLSPIIIILSIYSILASAPRNSCAKVDADPTIDLLYSVCKTNVENDIRQRGPSPDISFNEMYPPRMIFPSSDGRAVYIGFGYQDSNRPWPVLKINRTTKEITDIYWLNAPFRGVCPSGSGRCYITSYQMRQILVLDDTSGEIVRDIRTGAYAPLFLAYDKINNSVLLPANLIQDPYLTSPEIYAQTFAENREELYPLHPTGRQSDLALFEISVDGGEARMVSYSNYPFNDCVGTAMHNSKRDRLFLGNGVPGFRLTYTTGPARTLGHLKLPPLMLFNTYGCFSGIAVDDKNDEVYLVAPLGGVLYVLDAATMAVKNWYHLEMGIRDIQFDPRERLFYITAYRSGDLIVFDADQKRIVKRIFIGRRARDLMLDPQTGVLLIASEVGFLEVPLRRRRGDAVQSPISY